MPNPKCNLPVEERERVINGARLWLTGEEEQSIRGLMPQYLFYDNIGDRQVFCSACRERFSVSPKQRGKHNSEGTCPRCGHKATWKVIGKYSYQMSTLSSWIKTAVAYPAGDGGLYIIAGEASRWFSWNNLAGEIDWNPWKVYYFRRSSVMMVSLRYVQGCRNFSDVETWIGYAERVKEPFAPNMMSYSGYAGDYNIIGLEEAMEASDFKFCQIIPFYEQQYGAKLGELDTARWMVKYLAWYALHPTIEMAVKFGLSEAVKELIVSGAENKRLLNWDGKTPAEFLRMSKTDAAKVIRAGMTFTSLKNWRACGRGLSIDEYIEICNKIKESNVKALVESAKAAGVSLTKAANYISRTENGESPARRLGIWKDYLDMAAQLDYDMKDITVTMPKGLQERHDAAAALIDYKAGEAEQKKYKPRYKKLEKKYAFEMDGLRIVIPPTSAAIVREGKTLHHCVGGYAARHMNGTTTILFLRKARTPGRSFLTIELNEKNGKAGIRQIHGYRNEGYEHGHKKAADPSQKYGAWLDTWLAWVNAGSKRDKDGRPILPGTEAKTA